MVIPIIVVRVWSSVSAVVNSKPYIERTALFANTIAVAAKMFRAPYRAGFIHAVESLAGSVP